MKDRIWTRGDVLAGVFTGLVAFAVYAWTAAPSVTLLDSGEFITAAEHFGVPHPTGYPLYTLLAWLFLLLPIGNAAWQAAIFSGGWAALAVGLSAALSRSFLRWLMGDFLGRWRGLLTIVPVTCGLLLAFSFSMWSQATTVKDYTLYSLLVCVFLSALYTWLRRPDCLMRLLLSFFFLALAFSTHHLTLAMAPLPFIAVLLVRRGMFLDLLVAGCLTALLAYLGFAILSEQPLVLKTAIRFFYCVMLGLVVLAVVRRGQLEWRLVAYLPVVVALGLLPYAYMPFASSTNPPMNWSYTRTPEGFFYAFNRSQYSGTLSELSLKSIGRLMGSSGQPAAAAPGNPPQPGERPLFSQIQDWAGFFWLQLGRSFTPIGVLGYFGALFVIFRLADVERRTWVYLLELGFVLAAFLQPITSGAEITVDGWWVQMPYHTYTNMLFALLVALGIALGCGALFSRFPRLAWMRFLLLLLPVVPLVLNEAGCSQRNRWFGWQFGHDMLKDLPEGSVFFGGTDPGRFVPTYMILGESTQPPGVKRDPDFDRRDLYIITQNGVGEGLYRRYLADQYGPDRLAPKNAFERWLGRADAYPKNTLAFPSEEEIREAIKKEFEKESAAGTPDPAMAHSVVTRLIWEKNKGSHDFFVEESYPLEWSYDHALPHGLVYQISKEPLKEIPADAVKKDTEFWNAYVASLFGNPEFARDYDAQRSFSKLRTTTGHIYQHWKMAKEAEAAYRQSLALWPGNPESLSALNAMLWERGDYEGVIKMMEPANAADPNNFPMWRMRVLAEKRKELEGDICGLTDALAKDPEDRDKTGKLLELYTTTGETNKIAGLLNKSVEVFRGDPEFLRKAVQFGEMNNLPAQEVAAARNLVAPGTNSGDDFLLLARAYFKNNDKTNFYPAARAAIRKGGLPMREAIFEHPLFAPWRQDEEFKSLHNPLQTNQ